MGRAVLSGATPPQQSLFGLEIGAITGARSLALRFG
jgi:hypothetical protein